MNKELYRKTRIHQLIALADLVNTDERFEGRLRTDYIQCIEDCIKQFETVGQRDNFDLGYIQGLEDGKKETQNYV